MNIGDIEAGSMDWSNPSPGTLGTKSFGEVAMVGCNGAFPTPSIMQQASDCAHYRFALKRCF